MPATANPQTSASETIEHLLDTAERLFAAEGVANVALTQIVAASGQKNRSALHYHFGSRGGVVTAVMDRRLVPINARRLALLEALPANAPLLAVLRANIAALARAVAEAPWGRDYISILAQVRFHPSLLDQSLLHDESLSGVRLARQKLAAAAKHVAPELLAHRFTWVTDAVVFALARWTRDTPASARTPAAISALIDELATFGAAGMLAAAPSSGASKP